MKRAFVLVITFLFFSTAVRAQAIQEENTKLPIKFEQSTEVFAGFNTLQDYEPSLFSASGKYDIWGPRFAASGGLFLEMGDTQVTLSATYKFFKHEKISLATGIIYNLNWLHEFSLTHNFLPCFYLEWTPVPFYTLELSCDLLFKLRYLFVFGLNSHPLTNITMAAYIKSTFRLPKDFLLYVTLSSIEYFRYMIFCAPSFIIGLEYTINDSFDVGLETAIRYIDFFTLSSHYADADIRLGVRYKW